ncbi:amidohydrolase [Neobacillus kokaensis]|uniref:Deaminase n=1 Tax=Neobacillus kokaensis TaxID=2759023 RepID=A0ABQ3N6J4_9BACI|nr:amidohydrolase [Neobacillus kokaensis]GHI00551.1 deaminase [Neobacillus kokaensis]
MDFQYWLTNVRLDCGYEYENNGIIRTKTEISHLLIDNGIITKVINADGPLITNLPQYNATNLLALPGFIEKHNHLDKTYMGMAWKSCAPDKKLLDRLTFEAQEAPELAKTLKTRAKEMLEVIVESGVTHIRTHVNIDTYSGLKNLECVRETLQTFSDKLTFEIVAFPQQGLLRSQAGALMKKAMKEGANLVGGLDPGGIDLNIEASLQQMMEIAVEADADIDIHLHDPGQLGLFTIKRLAALTEETGWNGRVTISHAHALADVSLQEVSEAAEILSALEISIASAVPIHRPAIPIPLLHDKGVSIGLGCDGFYDSWSPFGNGDILEKAGRLAERFRLVDEKSLTQALGFITGGKTTLDQTGKRLWPAIGDKANLVLVDASCSAEAVARRANRHVVIHNGKMVCGQLGLTGSYSDLVK